VNPVHNAPRLSVMGPGVQADRAQRGGWGRERFVTDRLGPTLPDFDRSSPAWGGGEGEVCYRQTRPDFSPAASPASPFPHPPKPSSQTQRPPRRLLRAASRSSGRVSALAALAALPCPALSLPCPICHHRQTYTTIAFIYRIHMFDSGLLGGAK
jgi:hypothetical protein